MKSKIGVSILAIFLLLLAPRATEAAKYESAAFKVAKYETRLNTIEQHLDSLNSPIQQMGPEASDSFQSGIDDVQMSFDEVTERLTMIRFIIDRESSAPQDKRDLALDELEVMEADIAALEHEAALLSKRVDSITWY